MLNIEIIKFEAQDVITASGVAKPEAKPEVKPACAHDSNVTLDFINQTWHCPCGASAPTVTREDGTKGPGTWTK